MTIGQNLKLQIIANLQALISKGMLGSFISMDSGKDPITLDPPGDYPFAIVSMPQFTSSFEDNGSNLRVYRWDILFIAKLENLVDGDVEMLIENVAKQFDDNFTLNGVADGAVMPAEILSWPVSSTDKTFSCFVLTLKARALYELGSLNLKMVDFIDEEIVDGNGTTFILANTPVPGSVHLFAEGTRLSVALGDYTINGKNITMSESWLTGQLIADYRIFI